jgi:hypothetical protein
MSGDLSLGFPIGNFSISKYPSRITPNIFGVMSSAKWYEPLFNSSTTTAPGQNTLTAVPLYIPNALTLDRIAIDCGTGQVGGAGRIGIYSSDSNDLPSSLVLDAGQVALTSSGIFPITISLALSPGLYWLAYASQGSGTQPSIRVISGATFPIASSLNTTAPVAAGAGKNGYGHNVSNVSGSLPSTFVAGSVTTLAPRILVRTA